MKRDINSRIQSTRRNIGKKSLFAFAKTYLSHHMKYNPSPAHHEIYDLLDVGLKKHGIKSAIAAPRKFGKSTMVTFMYVIYSVCYGIDKFIVIISEGSSQANQVLENIKIELTSNTKLREDFPEVCELGGRPKPPKWREDDIMTKTNIRILALSTGQKIRGRRFGQHRPTTIFCDDIESEQSVRSADQREKIRKWFSSAVLNAGDEKTNYFFIGNLHHSECLLAEYVQPTKHISWHKIIYKALMALPENTVMWDEWRKIRSGQSEYKSASGIDAAKAFYEANQPALDKGALSLWPDRWSTYYLMSECENNPKAFYSEMQNVPDDAGMRIFDLPETSYWNRYYPNLESLIRAIGDAGECYMACDPSTGSPGGDYSAILIILKDKRTNVLYVVVADIGRYKHDEMITRIIDYQKRFNCVAFGYETNGFQELLVERLLNEASRQSVLLPIREVKNTANKIMRISGLQSYFRTGLIHCNENDKVFLEQILSFPYGKHDDAPDALEMVVRLAIGGGSLADGQIEFIDRDHGRLMNDDDINGSDFSGRDYLDIDPDIMDY